MTDAATHFERESVKKWRRVLHKELRWLKLPSEDPVYRAAMICAAIYCFGTDPSVICEVSGQSPPFVKTVLKRLRKTRILAGQTLRASGKWQGHLGAWGMMLDAMVAAGDLYRPPDEKRSAAAKARKQGPRQPRSKREKPADVVFAPKVTNSNPLYGLAEWENGIRG